MVISNSVEGFAKRCCFTLAVMPTVSILIITDIVNQAFADYYPASKFGFANSSSFAFVVEASIEVVITIELVSKQPFDLARNKVITKDLLAAVESSFTEARSVVVAAA